MSSTTTPPAIGALRARTAASHQRLEDALDLMGEGFGRDDYPALLARFLGFYEPLEARLRHACDWAATELDPAERSKVASLEADLRALGVDPAAVPRATDLPDAAGLAKALGVMYVVEGATLGGQHITRRLHERWGLTAETGGAFFRSYGELVGPRWVAFRHALEAWLTTDDGRAEAADAAAETFDKLHAWMAGR